MGVVIDWGWAQVVSVLIAFAVAAILLRYLRKISMLMRIGIVLFLAYPVIADEYASAGQTPILAPPSTQLQHACMTFSDVLGQSDYALFLSNDYWPCALNNSSIGNFTA